MTNCSKSSINLAHVEIRAMLPHQSIPEVEAATWKRITKNCAKIIAYLIHGGSERRAERDSGSGPDRLTTELDSGHPKNS
jgi:hypothetical protein